MKKQLQDILAKIAPALVIAQKYSRFMYFIFLMGLCGFLVYQINSFASVTPSNADVADKLKTITRPRIDQSAVTQIEKMQDQNVQVKSLINDARNNPFSE